MTFLHGFLIAMALAAVPAAFLVLACCPCAVSGSANADGDRLARERGRRG